MWISRTMGLLLALGGAGLLGFIWSEVLERSPKTDFLYRVGMPGVMLLATLGLILFVFGAHLLVAPGSAMKRWTLRRPRKAQPH